MVKHSKPESPHLSEEAVQEDFSRAHPLNRHRTQTDELLEKSLRRHEADDFKIKEVAEWKLCVNAVASTSNGRLLLKSMLQYSGVLEAPKINSPNQMVTNAIKGAFYLTWIRPYLEPDVRKELE